MDSNAEQPEKVKKKSVTAGQLANKFSGMDFNAEQPEKVSYNSVASSLKVM